MEQTDTQDPAVASEPAPIPAWTELGLSEAMLAAIEERGYEFPTPVQVQALPPAVNGKDLLVRSKTGTGKTAAFMIPAIQL